MTEDDRYAVAFRFHIINRIIETYGDSIYALQDGLINIDLIFLGPDKLRAYLLQGTTLYGVIPFGNDYYVDIDSDDNLIAFYRFSHSYIPIDISQAGDDTQAMEVIHSHTADNPFFTPLISVTHCSLLMTSMR